MLKRHSGGGNREGCRKTRESLDITEKIEERMNLEAKFIIYHLVNERAKWLEHLDNSGQGKWKGSTREERSEVAARDNGKVFRQ